jgi:hypothetical protein
MSTRLRHGSYLTIAHPITLVLRAHLHSSNDPRAPDEEAHTEEHQGGQQGAHEECVEAELARVVAGCQPEEEPAEQRQHESGEDDEQHSLPSPPGLALPHCANVVPQSATFALF